MKVLLTGDQGFIGSCLRTAFEAAGHEVLGFDLKNNQDLRDPTQVVEALKQQPEVVCHQAAFTSVPASLKNPRECFEVNLMGTLNLLQACELTGTPRIVFASSCGVYGPRGEGYESAFRLVPRNPYTVSKMAAERAIICSGLNYGILRYSNVYGPTMVEAGKTSVVAKFLASSDVVDVHRAPGREGSCIRDFVSITDVVKANREMLQGRDSLIMNVGSGVGLSIREVADLMGKASRMVDSRPGDIYRCDIRVAKYIELCGTPVSPKLGLPALCRPSAS